MNVMKASEVSNKSAEVIILPHITNSCSEKLELMFQVV